MRTSAGRGVGSHVVGALSAAPEVASSAANSVRRSLCRCPGYVMKAFLREWQCRNARWAAMATVRAPFALWRADGFLGGIAGAVDSGGGLSSCDGRIAAHHHRVHRHRRPYQACRGVGVPGGRGVVADAAPAEPAGPALVGLAGAADRPRGNGARCFRDLRYRQLWRRWNPCQRCKARRNRRRCWFMLWIWWQPRRRCSSRLSCVGAAAASESSDAMVLILRAQPLRQWLGILHNQYRAAQWPLTAWPDWVTEVPKAGGPLPQAFLH